VTGKGELVVMPINYFLSQPRKRLWHLEETAIRTVVPEEKLIAEDEAANIHHHSRKSSSKLTGVVVEKPLLLMGGGKAKFRVPMQKGIHTL